MRRKWFKWGCWIVLTPILLFVILMVLLYIPPVQNLLRREATEYASQKTGMQISVRRIDLRFPLNLLVRGVEVIQAPDTLLTLERLNVSVQALPLLRGNIAVDDITLEQASVNSAHLIKEMRVKGVLGRFVFQSHGVDLKNETALINRALLSDTHLQLILNDTTETPKDTASAPVRWKIDLRTLQLKNVSFSMQLPADSMRLAAHVANAEVKEASADLGQQLYSLKQFLLSGSSVGYDLGESDPAPGFDPSHIALRDINVGIDSAYYRGRNIHAVIREFSLNERSGLNITSLTGRIFADSTLIRIPRLRLTTPHSEVDLTAQTYWELINIPTTGHLSARLSALIGKQDLALLMPNALWEEYPFRPLVIQAGTEGNLKQMQISRFKVDLPGAFTLTGGGELWNLTDSIARSASVDLDMVTRNLSFLTSLFPTDVKARMAIPDGIRLAAHLGMDGPQFKGRLRLSEGKGSLNAGADFNSSTEAYSADLKIEALQLHHFLPKDSLYELSASVSARGRGVDVTSYRSSALLKASVDTLHYGHYHLSGIRFDGALKSAVASAKLTSNNELLQMSADGEYHLAHSYPDGKVTMDVTRLNLHQLGIAPQPLKRPFAFRLSAEARKDRVFAQLQSGDMKLNLSALAGVYPLIKQSTHFADVLMKQLHDKMLDHAELREALPNTIFSFSAGRNNPLAWYLDTKKIFYKDVSVTFGSAPDWGINGKASIRALQIDTLQLDTLFFTVKQDTSFMKLRGGVVNGPHNPQRSFKAELSGEIRTDNADLTLHFENGKGETGVLLGVNARPLTGGSGRGNGVALTLTPAEPIIAFRKFRFVDDHNWIYLHRNMRVYANVDLMGPDAMGFRLHSIQGDTTALQNMDVELRRIRLADISSVMPYFPALTGLISAEGHYIQTEKSLELSLESTIDELTYERQRIGDVTLGATWLPGENGKQYVNTYLTHDKVEVMLADGALYPTASGKDSIEVNASLEHFPLKIANAFVPDQLVALSGDLDGELHITGSPDKPLLNGQLVLDSVAVLSSQVGARFQFDSRPVPVHNSRIQFDKFAIFTTSTNPFTIDGYVDFHDLSRPLANLNLLAENYTLLNAKRTKESLAYGKVLVDLKSTVRGPLSELVMRGNINLLPSTDVTYVYTDSPLSVQDRLSDLVTFTSFSDTTATQTKEEIPTVSLGGLDMLMNIQIDPSVRLKVDLNADRSNRVELQGGGNLSLQYTPQGDLTLSGRYTMTDGLLKYSFPIIPLKDFSVNNGSYVEWTGNPMDPMLNFTATERVRASVGGGDNGASRMVAFDISIVVKNRLDDLSLAFEINAPEDATVQNQLASMAPDERSKQAIAMLVTNVYLADTGSGSGLNMGSALNSMLTSQINSLAGNIKNASISVGVEDHQDAEVGGKRTDYSFRYSQRFFNDRFQVILGGKVSTGANATNDAESFIDNVSLEYRLDASGSRYIRLFHDKNYESVLEGEITETGVGLVLRKKMDRLGELFIFRNKSASRTGSVNKR